MPRRGYRQPFVGYRRRATKIPERARELLAGREREDMNALARMLMREMGIDASSAMSILVSWTRGEH